MLGFSRQFVRRFFRPVCFPDYGKSIPVSTVFGLDRGLPVDRYYIAKFLEHNRACIQGRVLEVGDSTYSREYGGCKVDALDILSPSEENSHATIIADLADANTLPENLFDCFICTQTFNFIFDVQQAVVGAHRLLKPGGVLLATVAGICQISRYDMDRWGDYWRFTTASVERIFRPIFGDSLQIHSYGNVVAAMALLQGVVYEDLPKPALLDMCDHDYQVLITVVARKKADLP